MLAVLVNVNMKKIIILNKKPSQSQVSTLKINIHQCYPISMSQKSLLTTVLFIDNMKGTELIVDFPSKPRRKITSTVYADDNGDSSTGSEEGCKAVRFMSILETHYIGKKSQEDIQAAWYSRKERNGFRKDTLKDISEIREKISTAELLSTEDECRCIGLEFHLREGLKHVVSKNRMKHRYAVLQEQQKQLNDGHHDAIKLSRTSRKMSKWARETARELGKITVTRAE